MSSRQSRFHTLTVVSTRISSADWERIESVASRSETTTEKWLRNAIMHSVACDEAHFEEQQARDEAVRATDREKLRLLLNGNGHHAEPSKELLDILTDRMALARTEGRAGLALVARRARDLAIAADVAFETEALSAPKDPR